jgi:hypothetical protein
MTHDVLQSDIDLARRLSEARCPDSEIVIVLTYRGIDSSRAARLIADIQSGKTVEPDKPIAINLARKTSAEPFTSGGQRRGRSAKDSSKRGRGNRRGQPNTSAFPWTMIIALASAVVCVTVFAIISRKSHTDSQERSHAQAADSNSHNRAVNATNISLEIQQDELRLCNNSIARENFLSTIFNILGTPSRTNQVEKLEQVVYAYDQYGLLIYSPRNTRKCSIVLDFEAIDGPAGTRNPFVGVFKINGNALHVTTDAASLALISELGLEPAKSSSGILRAQIGGLELVFAYFKTPERLSLAEIDFK